MLKPQDSLAGKNTYLTIHNRNADDELVIGGCQSGSYAPEAASSTDEMTTIGDPIQEIGKPGVGEMPMTFLFGPGSLAHRTLQKLFRESRAEVFNIYMGAQVPIHDATATGHSAAKITIETATGKTEGALTGELPNWGDADTEGEIDLGCVVQVEDAMWWIRDLSNTAYDSTTKLVLEPVAGAADVATKDYRIFKPRRVLPNFVANVSLTGGWDWNTDGSQSKMPVTLHPRSILSLDMFVPIGWDVATPLSKLR